MATAKKISSIQTRSMTLEQGAIDEEKRTLEMSFSSEHPVERSFRDGSGTFQEVLDHSPASVSLNRLNGQAALLLNHDPDRQIGVVERAWLDGKKLRATVRFSSSSLGEEIFRDVKDGIRNLVSIGYRLTDRSKVDIEERDGVEAYRFRAWEPYEGSIVSIPADPTVGVGRNQEANKSTDFELPMKRNLLLDAAPPVDGGAAPAESRDQILKLERSRKKELREIAEQFKGRVENIDELRNQAEDNGIAPDSFARSLIGKMSTSPIPNGETAPAATGRIEVVNEARSLGEMLVRSDMFRAFASKKSPAFGLEVPGSFREHLTRATLLSTGLTSIQKIPGVVLVDQQPLRVSDLFGQGTTNATTIRFTKESSFTNAATAVAEEGEKPEATLALAEEDVTIQKIAVIGRVSDEMIADYDYVQSYVNSQLLFMVAALEDNHLINGLGASNQIKGVLNVTGIQTQAYTANLADTIHKAKTKVQSTPGFVGVPDSIVINPADYQNLRLTKDSAGQYLLGGPAFGQYGNGGLVLEPPIWGLRPVITTAIAQGTAIVGAFKVGATLYRKGGVMLDSTNSDASDFKYNRICIRAEERLALVSYKPKAFCKITGIPAA
jgi:HK97 family phage major capsid protein